MRASSENEENREEALAADSESIAGTVVAVLV
jgi:hypothetical protein